MNRTEYAKDSSIIFFSKNLNIFRLIAILVLILSFLKWPYGYYIFLKYIVTFTISIMIYKIWTNNNRVALITLSILLLIFNPLFPLHLDKEIWTVIDFSAALVILSSFVWIKISNKTTNRNEQCIVVNAPLGSYSQKIPSEFICLSDITAVLKDKSNIPIDVLRQRSYGFIDHIIKEKDSFLQDSKIKNEIFKFLINIFVVIILSGDKILALRVLDIEDSFLHKDIVLSKRTIIDIYFSHTAKLIENLNIANKSNFMEKLELMRECVFVEIVKGVKDESIKN